METRTDLQLKEHSTALIAILTNQETARDFERGLTIQKIIATALPICEVQRLSGKKEVAIALDVQLTKLVASFNLNLNLNDFQIKTIVEDLIDKYRNETIEDFILVFKKARQNEFGTIYRIDSAVIFEWMGKYLDEKYQAIEGALMNEKETFYKPIKPEEKTEEEVKPPLTGPERDDMIKKWKAKVDAIEVKRVKEISLKEVRELGQEKPKAINRPHTDLRHYNMQERIKMEAARKYKDFHDFRSFQHFTVQMFQVYAKSKEDAEEIYIASLDEAI